MVCARIIVVEDEPKVVHLLREVLTAGDYEVTACCSGEHAVQMIAMERFDLVVLDILLPGEMDGYAVAHRLREFSNIPIIMLTGKVRESDILQGFESGADDYITKPFSSKELLARIAALLKRSHQDGVKTEAVIECDGLRIDLARRRVTMEGKEIHLTHTEYNLLHELASHCNQVLLHEHLLTTVWGPEYRNDIDYLRAYIHNLRQKIEPNPDEPSVIVRCPGVGYMLATKGE